MTTPKTKYGSVDTRRETARLLAVLEEHPGGMTIRELTEARDATRGDLPKLSESKVRDLVAGMSDSVLVTYDSVTRPSGTEVWSARKLAPTIPIDTGAHPPRDYPVYSVRLDPPGGMIGGYRIYRQDPGESCYHVLAQGLTESEARTCVVALNDMVEARLERDQRAPKRA